MKLITVFLSIIYITVPYVYSQSPQENLQENTCKIEYSIDSEGNVKLTTHIPFFSNNFKDVSLKDDDGLISLLILYNQLMQENKEPSILTKDQERILKQGLERFESYFKNWELALSGKKMNKKGKTIDLTESDGDYFAYYTKFSILNNSLKKCNEEPNGCPEKLRYEEMNQVFFKYKIKSALRSFNELNENNTISKGLQKSPPILTKENIAGLGKFIKSRADESNNRELELVSHSYELTKPTKDKFFLCQSFPDAIPRCLRLGCADNDFRYFNSINQGLCGKLEGGYSHVYPFGENPCPQMKFVNRDDEDVNIKKGNLRNKVKSN